mmetsp:Transcript_7002/g.10260  ORF Transcript_7002/g.10260 Transcript_7002/m.10260 type:complete len:138 (+) Transcript_7002:150-563(+)
MKSTSAAIVTAILSLAVPSCAIGHNGYTHDISSHGYEHKEDLEKLRHPNQQKEIVHEQGRRGSNSASDGAHRVIIPSSQVLVKAIGVEEEDMAPSRKALLMGVQNGFVMKNSAIANVVTNILEASAAVERESVVDLD